MPIVQFVFLIVKVEPDNFWKKGKNNSKSDWTGFWKTGTKNSQRTDENSWNDMTFKTEPKTWTPIECYLQGLFDNEIKDPKKKQYWEAQADAKNYSC